MVKWVVTKLLSKREGGFIQLGEIIELSDEQAAPLLKMDAIAPAEQQLMKPSNFQQMSRKRERK